MKKSLFLASILIAANFILNAQSVFSPTDPIVRYNAGAALGSAQRPDPNIPGLQKWVSISTTGVSTSWDASAFKSYYINTSASKRMSFRVRFPRNWSDPANANKKYPALLFFHGAGEFGCPDNGGLYNNEKHLLYGARLFNTRVANGTFDGFLVFPMKQSPDCWGTWPNGGAADYQAINDIMDSLAKYVRLDLDRVIATGLSSGGFATFNYAANYPTRVAKIAPAAASYLSSNFMNFLHIPIWFATGGKDTNPTPASALTTQNNIKNAGGNVLYTLYPTLGHSVWNTLWAESGFLPFMNDLHKANPLVFFDRYEWCPTDNIQARMGLTNNFAAYEWQKDGVTIARRENGVNTVLINTNVVNYTGNEITVNAFGTYSARFKRFASSEWSEWSMKPAVIKSKPITQTPPIEVDGLRSRVLPSPDGSTTVPLKMADDFFGYKWFSNTDNSLISEQKTFNAGVGEYKGQVVEEFGCGTLFSPVFKVIDANGFPKPEPAKNLVITQTTQTTTRIEWSQNPNAGSNETGFEVYRATKAGGPYTLVHITAPDVLFYVDQNLPINTEYYYIVRAVNNTGAAVVSNEASTSTLNDSNAPTAPGGLTFRGATENSVSLRWNASTDDAGIKRYDIYANGVKSFSTTGTSFTVYDLTPSTNYTFVVKAVDITGNESAPSSVVTAYTHLQGLNYNYHHGEFPLLPNFSTEPVLKTGFARQVDAGTSYRMRADNYAIKWEGYIYAPVAGTYIFETTSDDGSRLYINTPYSQGATPLVNNDGLHGPQFRTGSISLTKGYHPIVVTFFERTGGETMEIWWSNVAGGITRERIPQGFLAREVVDFPAEPAAPSDLIATAQSSSTIGLNWTDNSADETGFELVRSLAANGPFVPVAAIGANINSYIDTALNPLTTYYYRVRSVGAASQSAWIWGAQSNATTSDLEAGPTVPGNPAAQLLTPNSIQFSFDDASSNETGFEIRRSVGSPSNFRYLATLPAGNGGRINFTDTGLFANTTFYYQVRATGPGNPSAYSASVSAQTGNRPPVMTDVLDFTMRFGTSFDLPLQAMDPDGDVLTIRAMKLPRFATIQNLGNGIANLKLNPKSADRGSYTMRMIAQDPSGEADTTFFTFVVNTNTVPTIAPIPDVTMNEGGTISIPLSANDAEGNSKLFYVVEDLPSFSEFTYNGNGTGTLELSPGFGDGGVYDVEIKVDDGFGAWTSRKFALTVNEVNPNQTLRLSFRSVYAAPATWNSVTVTPLTPGFNVTGLRNTANVVTPIGINVFSGSYTVGLGSQSETGVFPNNVIREGITWGSVAGVADDTLIVRVHGLSLNKQYDFVFFGNLSCGGCGNSNSVATYRIGTEEASLMYYQNTRMTDTIYNVVPNASGEVFIRMFGESANNFRSALNAMVIEEHAPSTGVPAKPENIAAETILTGGALISWDDMAFDESNYLIYRSANRSGPYTLLNSNANFRDSSRYVDGGVNPLTRYFYYVVGINTNGLGASSDTLDFTTGNFSPVIVGGNNLTLKVNTAGVINFSVDDTPAETLTVSIPNKPSFVTLIQNGRNYQLDVSPNQNDVGWYALEVKVDDGNGGSVTKVFNISVFDQNTRSVYINFAASGKNAAAPWNNFTSAGAGATVNALRDETNVATPFSLQSLSRWDGTFVLGHITGNNSGVVPDIVLESGFRDDSAVSRKFVFKGLNQAMRYNISLVSSINEGITAPSVAKSGTETDTLNARNNMHQTANLNGLIPNASGEISFDYRMLGVMQYLNAIILEEYSPAITIMNPSNLYAEPVNTTSVNLTWSDRAIGENANDGFEIQRATDANFTSDLVTVSLRGGSSQYLSTGLTPNTRYFFRVRAKLGIDYSEFSNLAETITPESQVLVNFNFQTANAASPWNNLQSLAEEQTTYGPFTTSTGGGSGISLTFEQLFNGENNAGKRTGNNSGVVPDNVLGGSYWVDRSQVATIRVAGLNQNKYYRFGFIASIGNPGWPYPGNYTATYTINGRTVYLNAWENTSKMVHIGNIIPDENGEVLIELSTTDLALYGFHSGMIIEQYDDATGGTLLNQADIQPEDKEVVLADIEPAMGQLKMYPNPFVNRVSVDFYNTSATDRITVDIVDVSGRVAYRKDFGTLAPGFNTLNMQVQPNKFSKGVYIVTLRVNNKPVKSGKLMRSMH